MGLCSPARGSEQQIETRGAKEREIEAKRQAARWDTTCPRSYFHMPAQCTGPSRGIVIQIVAYSATILKRGCTAYEPVSVARKQRRDDYSESSALGGNASKFD